MAKRCAICGADALRECHGTYTYMWPEERQASTTFSDAAWERCMACGEEFLPAELIRRIEEARYTREGLLPPAEIRAIRERLGLSQVEMARLLGVGDKTYARWELGYSVQNKSMDNLIRVAAVNPELLKEIEAQRQPPSAENRPARDRRATA